MVIIWSVVWVLVAGLESGELELSTRVACFDKVFSKFQTPDLQPKPFTNAPSFPDALPFKDLCSDMF